MRHRKLAISMGCLPGQEEDALHSFPQAGFGSYQERSQCCVGDVRVAAVPGRRSLFSVHLSTDHHAFSLARSCSYRSLSSFYFLQRCLRAAQLPRSVALPLHPLLWLSSAGEQARTLTVFLASVIRQPEMLGHKGLHLFLQTQLSEQEIQDNLEGVRDDGVTADTAATVYTTKEHGDMVEVCEFEQDLSASEDAEHEDCIEVCLVGQGQGQPYMLSWQTVPWIFTPQRPNIARLNVEEGKDDSEDTFDELLLVKPTEPIQVKKCIETEVIEVKPEAETEKPKEVKLVDKGDRSPTPPWRFTPRRANIARLNELLPSPSSSLLSESSSSPSLLSASLSSSSFSLSLTSSLSPFSSSS